MSHLKSAQYPSISNQHRIHLSRRNERTDLAGPVDHSAIRRGFLALLLRHEGKTPADALRIAYEVYPDARM